MDRIISAFRLLPPMGRPPGPLIPSADPDVPPESIGDFLNATYVAVEKMRLFGLADDDFGGKLKVVARKPGEKANGRYYTKTDESEVFFPPLRGAPDWPWTIIHELLHRVWVKHVSEDSKRVWELLCDVMGKPITSSEADALVRKSQSKPDSSNLWFYFKKHFGDNLSGFKQWLMTRRYSDSFPSDYSSTDPSEAFSEVGAEIVLGRGRAGREIRRTGSMAKKLFLDIVEPLRKRGISEDGSPAFQDDNFLQLQVDFLYLRWKLDEWVSKNLSDEDVIKTPPRPHATLSYGADKRDLPQIRRIAQNFGRAIRMSLGAINVFERPDYDVLYIELVGDAMLDLHKELQGLPHQRVQDHEYRPHVTVAYVKKGKGRRYVGNFPFRMVASSRSITAIDSAGIEFSIPTSEDTLLQREPLLLANT